MKKGISLVALIITIIVLIILTAAVIMSEEGTWEISELAVFKNDVSTVQEAVTTKILNNSIYAAVNVKNAETYKWVGVAEDYIYDETTGPTFNVVINGISTVKLSEAIKENINISDTELSQYYVDNKGIIYYYDVTTQKGFEYEGITYYNATMTNQTTINTASGTTLGDLIDANMYGTTVSGYTAGGVSDWKVFYKQTVDGEEYVYLIASDLLSETQIPSITGAIKGSYVDQDIEYGIVYWDLDAIPELQTIEESTKSLFMANWGDYSTNANGKCISALLNTINWSAFATPTNTDIESYVKGAIGSPTAEMFAASWTENGGISLSLTNIDPWDGEVSELGYLYNHDGIVIDYYIDNVKTGEADIDLYFLTNNGNEQNFYWLSSPIKYPNEVCSIANYDTSFSDFDFDCGRIDSSIYGVRPVVCLKSSIPASLSNEVITLLDKGIGIESIAITTPPTKTLYRARSTFNPDGMVVTARYKNGTSEVINGYKVRPCKDLSITDTEVVISYAGSNTIQAITVKPNILNESGTTLGEIIMDGNAYGASVIGYTAGGVSDWKVFYKQTVDGEENVYLIASELLNEEQIPSIAGASKDTYIDDDIEYGTIYWESTPASQEIEESTKSLFMANWSDYSTNANGKCISALLNTSNWSAFAAPTNTDIESYVKGAIGSPTAEMFAASWTENAVKSLSLTDTNPSYVNASTFGYYYNHDGIIGSYNRYVNTENADMDLYFLINNSNADEDYWLASPSANKPNQMCSMCSYWDADDGDYKCVFDYGYTYKPYYGLRPVVCIQAGILASVSEGVITLNP